jgi:hypothetical protein
MQENLLIRDNYFIASMMRERKNKIYKIEKLHEFIDSASLPKNKNTSSHNDKNRKFVLNQLSDDQLKSKKKGTSYNLIHPKSESLKPRAVVHKREDIQKKEGKVIQIELGPKAIKKQKEHAIVNFTPLRQDLFAEESLYEIEKVVFLEEEPVEVKPTDISKKSDVQQEFIQLVSDWEYKEKDIPEWELVTKETELRDGQKKTQEQKQINGVIKIAAEAKKRRKLKTFDRKRQKEGKKQRKKKRNYKRLKKRKPGRK